jgi:hypothetical protein
MARPVWVVGLLVVVGCASTAPKAKPPIVTAPKAKPPPAANVAPPITELTFCAVAVEPTAEDAPIPYEDTPVPCNDQGIDTIEKVAALKSLKKLTLVNEWKGGYAAIAGLDQLEELDVVYARPADLASLESLTHLRVLDIDTDADLAPLGKLPALEQLTLTTTSDLMTLPMLPKLKRLQLTGPSAHGTFSMTSLADQPDLEAITLDTDAIADAGALAKLTKLTTVSLTSTHAVRGLGKLRKIANLDLDVPIEAVSFAQLTSMRKRAPQMTLYVSWSPCDLPEVWEILPDEKLTRAEYDQYRHDNHACRNQGD